MLYFLHLFLNTSFFICSYLFILNYRLLDKDGGWWDEDEEGEEDPQDTRRRHNHTTTSNNRWSSKPLSMRRSRTKTMLSRTPQVRGTSTYKVP
jgi:hypothetical protein